MTQWIKQSTSVTVKFGPFVDKTDGVTLETGLATAMDNATTGIRVSKNGGNYADRNDATVPAHDEMGDYDIVLSTTDTNTLGTLKIIFEEAATCLPVWQDFMVVTANAWDTFFGADTLQADVTQMGGVAQSATDLKDFADAGYDPATNKVQGVVLVDTTTTNTDMRGTETAATAANLATAQADLDILTGTDGATLATAQALYAPAKAGDNMGSVTSNIELGPAEIAAELATYDGPTNTEMVAAFTEIKGATWATTDTLEGIRDELVIVDTNVDDIETAVNALKDFDQATETVDIGKISGNATSATNLRQSTLGMVTGAATGTPTTTTMAASALSETTDDHYIGRTIVWLTGSLAGQGSNITDYTGATRTFTFTATTEACVATDTFVIV